MTQFQSTYLTFFAQYGLLTNKETIMRILTLTFILPLLFLILCAFGAQGATFNEEIRKKYYTEELITAIIKDQKEKRERKFDLTIDGPNTSVSDMEFARSVTKLDDGERYYGR